jgi:putative sigma-54 modulation protein
MEIIVSGRHIDITDAIRAYATEKVSKLPRYFDRVQAIEVVADKASAHGHAVEIIVRAEHVDPFIATVSSADLYACIDEAVDKLERQLTDHKEKLRNRKHGAPR